MRKRRLFLVPRPAQSRPVSSQTDTPEYVRTPFDLEPVLDYEEPTSGIALVPSPNRQGRTPKHGRDRGNLGVEDDSSHAF